MNNDALRHLTEWAEERRAHKEEEQERCKKKIISTYNWLPARTKTTIAQLSQDLAIPSEEIFLEMIRDALWSWRDLTQGLPFEELWKRFEPFSLRDKFFSFAEEHFSEDKLQAYRRSQFDSLKRRWKKRLSDVSKRRLVKLEDERGIEYYPEEKELVQKVRLPQKEFLQYEKDVLQPRLKSILDANAEGTKTVPLSNHQDTNRQLAIANDMIKRQRDQIKSLKKQDRRNVYLTPELADECRFKNGKLNFSKLGRMLNVSYHTAQHLCNEMHIPTKLDN